MTNTRVHVDSLFMSRSPADQVLVRTYVGTHRDSYVIYSSWHRPIATREKRTVRAYIVRHDCHAVESFEE